MPHVLMGSGTIIAGIVVGLLASCVQSLGLTIQRKSHVLNQALPLEQQRLEHRRPLWLLGFAIFLSSNILGSIFQIASLPVVILAPLGAVSLLWNAFFARILLGDGFSPWVFIGTLLIAGGAVLIGIFGIVPEPTHSLEDLLALFRRPTFIVYFSLLGLILAVCLVITHVAEFSYFRRLRHLPSLPSDMPSVIPTESSLDLPSTERTPLLDRKPPPSVAASVASSNGGFARIRPSRVPLTLALSYASHSGIVSGMCLIFAKSGVELLLLTIGGDNQFWRWQAWMLLFGLVGFALLQLWYLHKALKLADPTIVCPLAFCFYNVSSIVNGLVYYDQFALLSRQHLVLVVTGIVVLLGGVWAVSYQSIEVVPWTAEPEDENALAQEVIIESVEPLHEEAGAPEDYSEAEEAEDRPARFRRRATTEARAMSQSLLLPGEASRTLPRRRHTMVGTPDLTLSPPPAPGFSIGLSPVSPGFSLVPRRGRRRGSASITSGGGGSGSIMLSPDGMRRSVSEGLRWDLEAGGERQREGAGRSERIDEPVETRSGKAGRSPWRWVRGLFARRK